MSVLHREDPKVTRLAAIDLFGGADQKALVNLAKSVDEVSVPEGREIISEGHHHSDGYVVVDGVLGVRIGSVEVAEINPGELVGELAFLDYQPTATATVYAKTAVELLAIPYNRFDQILDDNPGLAKQIARQLARRLRSLDELYRERDDDGR